MFGGCSNTLRGTPNVQMQGAQKIEPRGVYENTLSGAVCSATQQTMCPSGYERSRDLQVISTAPSAPIFYLPSINLINSASGIAPIRNLPSGRIIAGVPVMPRDLARFKLLSISSVLQSVFAISFLSKQS